MKTVGLGLIVVLLAACSAGAESDEDVSATSEALAACPPARAAHTYYAANDVNGIQVTASATCGSALYLVGYTNNAGERDIWVQRRTVSDGSVYWTKTLGVAGQTDEGSAAAVDASCNLYVGASTTSSSIDLGNGPLAGGTSYFDPLLMKIAPNGKVRWSKRLYEGGGGYNFASIHGLAVDAAGGLAVVGQFTTSGGATLDAGGGAMTGLGAADIFLAKYDASNGAYKFAIDDGTDGGDDARGVVVNANGDVLVTGTLQQSSFIPYLAKYSGVDGTRIFQRQITSYGTSTSNGIGLDPVSGDVVIGGMAIGTLDFGNGTKVTSPPNGPQPWIQGIAGWAAKMSSVDGTPGWVKSFESTAAGTSTEVWSVGVGACGDVYLAGSFQDTVTFGTVPRTVPSPEKTAAWVARYSSAGTPIWDAIDASETTTLPAGGLALNNNNNVLFTASTVSDSFTARVVRYRD